MSLRSQRSGHTRRSWSAATADLRFAEPCATATAGHSVPMLLPSEMAEHRQRLAAIADEAGRDLRHPGLVAGRRERRRRILSIYPSLDDAHRRQAMVGTVEQIVEQLVAYRDAGVCHVHTFVGSDDTIGVHDPVDGMELSLREVWPAFLAN